MDFWFTFYPPRDRWTSTTLSRFGLIRGHGLDGNSMCSFQRKTQHGDPIWHQKGIIYQQYFTSLDRLFFLFLCLLVFVFSVITCIMRIYFISRRIHEFVKYITSLLFLGSSRTLQFGHFGPTLSLAAAAVAQVLALGCYNVFLLAGLVVAIWFPLCNSYTLPTERNIHNMIFYNDLLLRISDSGKRGTTRNWRLVTERKFIIY